MARVDLAVQKISAAGVAQQTAVAGIADGHSFINNTGGKVLARVENTNGVSARTVTFQTTKQIDGLALADQVVAIPANGVSIIGPFKPETFNVLQGADIGKVYVDYQTSSESDLQIEVYSI